MSRNRVLVVRAAVLGVIALLGGAAWWVSHSPQQSLDPNPLAFQGEGGSLSPVSGSTSLPFGPRASFPTSPWSTPPPQQLNPQSSPHSADVPTIVAASNSPPAWAVPYGEELWNRSRGKGGSLRGVRGNPSEAQFDVGSVVDRVSSAFRQTADSAAWEASGAAYKATVTLGGLKLTPYAPPDATAPSGAHRLTDASNSPDSSAEIDVLFRTLSVRRGSEVLFETQGQGEASWTIQGNTVQTLRDPVSGLVEHYAARSSGVEVSWYAPEPLRGSGPMVIHTELGSLRYAGETSSGHHFADEAGTPRLRIGRAVAVDSDGQRLSIASIPARNGLDFIVPAEFLETAKYPVAIDPEIGPEFGMDHVVQLRAYEEQGAPAVAWDGTRFLVVWRDNRREESPVIFGARVNSGGVVEDPSGILISKVLSYQEMPAVAGKDGTFLVVWTDYRIGSGDIFGARVNSAGTVLDPNSIAITTAPNVQEQPAVTWQGSRFLVVWADYRNDTDFTNADIFGARIDTSGVIVGAGDFPICTAPGSQYAPSVAAVADLALVAWSDLRNGTAPEQQDIYGGRVDGAGSLLDAAGRLLSSIQSGASVISAPQSQQSPCVAANQTGFFVAWQDERNTPETDIYATLVGKDGSVAQVNGLALCLQEGLQAHPAAASDGTNFFAVWEDRRNGGQDLYGARVDAAGVLLDPAGTEVSLATLNQSLPKIVAGAGQYLAAWEDNRSGLFADIYGTRLDFAGTPIEADGFLISSTENQQHLPGIGWNGTYYLVAWRDFRRDNAFDLYGTRVTSGGSVVDPWGIKISDRASFNSYPSIGAVGTDFLLAWEHQLPAMDHNIFGRRVSGTTGDVLDATDLPLSIGPGDQYRASVQGGATGWLVVWGDNRRDEDYDLYGALVSKTGSITTSANGFPISTAPELQFSVRLAWNGTNFLAVWRDSRNAPSDDPDFANRLCDIYGRLIAPNGGLVGTQDIPICLLTDFRQRFPVVASDGARFFVAWEDNREGEFDIYGTGVAGNGQVTTPNGYSICSAPGAQFIPTITWDGNNYLVGWLDTRSGENDIYGRQVSKTGTPLGDDTGFPIANTEGSQLIPWVASAGQRRSMIVYQTKSPSLIGRIGARLVNDTGRTAPVFTSQPSLSALVASPYSYAVTVSDPDTPIPVIGAIRLPAWLTLVDRGNGTATLTGTPGSIDIGTNRVVLRVSDDVFQNAQAFELIVTPEVNSLRILSIERNGANVVICWESVPGKTYRLEYKDTVDAASWTPVTTVTGAANATSTCFSDIVSANQKRFYRVVLP